MKKIYPSLVPPVVCLIMFLIFVFSSSFLIINYINPLSVAKIVLEIRWFDVFVGFFLYFVTAIDYALIVGRMQVVNNGGKARLIMNVFTCLGCFVGVTLVLFLWGLAKEIDWLIVALLVFAGSVMVKLAYEGIDYFAEDQKIWWPIRVTTIKVLSILHHLTEGLTFWIPELGTPKIKKMSLLTLAKWSFLLPFIIGLDDFVGYMGAMTIYNVFSLLIGIYFADVFIDVLIFTSPKHTQKLVESSILSLLAGYAFLYLMYKSYSEAIKMVMHSPSSSFRLAYLVVGCCLVAYLGGRFIHQHYWKPKHSFKRS